jgi:hypothetical protein
VVLLSAKLKPNCFVPIDEVPPEDSAVIVLDPDVSVAPLTVTEYPELPLVEAAITEVPVAVDVVEPLPRFT